jgi:hypothetical protein
MLMATSTKVYDVEGTWPDAGSAVLGLCRKTLLGQHHRITHCLAQLSDAQTWWRPRPEMNAVGNLLLHLRGNVGQWIVAGVGQRPFRRDRPAEFSDRGSISKGEAESNLAAVISEAADVLAKFPPQDLLAARRIQGHETTALGAALHATSHFEGHAQEIVMLTRLQLAEAYRYAWTPQTPEQISAG